MTCSNANKFTNVFLGLLLIRTTTSGRVWADVDTDGEFNRVKVKVFKRDWIGDVTTVEVQKTIYLDNDISEELKYIQDKTEQLITEVLNNES